MRKVYLVNFCNGWKEFSTFRLCGIFTTRTKLNVVLNKLLKEETIEWNDAMCTDKFVNRLTDAELQDNLDYVSIEIITLNEIQ